MMGKERGRANPTWLLLIQVLIPQKLTISAAHMWYLPSSCRWIVPPHELTCCPSGNTVRSPVPMDSSRVSNANLPQVGPANAGRHSHAPCTHWPLWLQSDASLHARETAATRPTTARLRSMLCAVSGVLQEAQTKAKTDHKKIYRSVAPIIVHAPAANLTREGARSLLPLSQFRVSRL